MSSYAVKVIHGPNLNLLGKREKKIYGDSTLDSINSMIQEEADKMNCSPSFFQSNSEGEIIDFIHKSDGIDGIIINPGGYSHTSVSIRDAVSAVDIPVVEVHLTNLSRREDFRKSSYIAPVCIGQIAGFGGYSYILALHALINYIGQK